MREVSALRENTQLEWVFTTKSKAMKGVKSGKYYAAIVIPEEFSRNMMSVFTSEIRKPEITYYSNAKENAIAPKVTDKGATAVQTQVNEVFIETISDTVLTGKDQHGSDHGFEHPAVFFRYDFFCPATSRYDCFFSATDAETDKIQCGCLKRDPEIIFWAATVRFRRNGQYQYGTDCQQRVL